MKFSFKNGSFSKCYVSTSILVQLIWKRFLKCWSLGFFSSFFCCICTSWVSSVVMVYRLFLTVWRTSEFPWVSFLSIWQTSFSNCSSLEMSKILRRRVTDWLWYSLRFISFSLEKLTSINLESFKSLDKESTWFSLNALARSVKFVVQA